MFGKKDEELQIGKQEKNNKKKERVRNREIVIVTCFFSLLMLAVRKYHPFYGKGQRGSDQQCL